MIMTYPELETTMLTIVVARITQMDTRQDDQNAREEISLTIMRN